MDSPGVYTATVKRDFSEVVLPSGSVLVQHCDDLLIASVSADSSVNELLYCCKLWLIMDTDHLWQICCFICQKLSIWGTYLNSHKLAPAHVQLLSNAPAIGLPDYKLLFFLFVSERHDR